MNRINFKFVATVMLLVFLIVFLNNNELKAEAHLQFEKRLLKKGMEGADVAILQKKLKRMSLYTGKIDGLFGPATETAVKKFQARSDLKSDGIVGSKTYASLPKKALFSRMDISRSDIILLARIIHGEARGENFEGRVGVGAVILNRYQSKEFPNTIRKVILQKGQFSSLIDGQANLYPSQLSINAAKAALLGYDPTYEATYFYNPEVATNLKWISSRPVVKRIGDHVFAR